MALEDLKQRLAETNLFTNIKRGFTEVQTEVRPRTYSKEQLQYLQRQSKELLESGTIQYDSEIMAADFSRTRVSESTLHLAVYPTQFSHHFATTNHPSLKIWATGASSLTRADHHGEYHYLFGHRKKKDEGGHIEGVPGGYLEPRHFKIPHQDPLQLNLFEELREETGITSDYTADIYPLHIGQMKGRIRNSQRSFQDVSLEYVLDLKGLSPDEIQRVFKRQEREHDPLEIIPESQLVDYLEEHFDDLYARSVFTFDTFLQNWT